MPDTIDKASQNSPCCSLPLVPLRTFASVVVRFKFVDLRRHPQPLLNFSVMPDDTCSFCGRVFKSIQAVRSHRAQYLPCRVAWEQYLENLEDDIPPSPPLHPDDQIEEVYMDYQDGEDFAQGGPSPPSEMNWQPIDDMDAESIASVVSAHSRDGQSDNDMPESGDDSNDADSNDNDENEDMGYADQERPVDEEDEEHHVTDCFPNAGAISGTIDGRFSDILNSQLRTAGKNIHHPFKNEEELEFANWMHQSGMTMSQMDAFFKLQYVGNSFLCHMLV
jgi:hypothetical protein